MLARLPRTLALGAVVLATIAGDVSTAEPRGRLPDYTITGPRATTPSAGRRTGTSSARSPVTTSCSGVVATT